MISRVRGKLVQKVIDRAEIQTQGGVTYELAIPATVYEVLPKVGEEIELYAALVGREDGLELFGFRSELERKLFLRLKSASGIGPRLALTLLSAMSATQLVEAIRGRDLGRLQTVSGVGKKKAERIAVELADKLEDMAVATAVEAEPEAGTIEAVVAALVVLGYTRAEGESAARNVLRRRDADEGDVEALVREALAGLS